MSEGMKSELVSGALKMVINRRQPAQGALVRLGKGSRNIPRRLSVQAFELELQGFARS